MERRRVGRRGHDAGPSSFPTGDSLGLGGGLQHVPVLTKRLADRRYVDLERVLSDHGARPHAVHEIVLGDQFVGRVHQDLDDFEIPRPPIGTAMPLASNSRRPRSTRHCPDSLHQAPASLGHHGLPIQDFQAGRNTAAHARAWQPHAFAAPAVPGGRQDMPRAWACDVPRAKGSPVVGLTQRSEPSRSSSVKIAGCSHAAK